MAFCRQCGKQLVDGAEFCPYCGAKDNPGGAKSASDDTVMGILAYIGILVLVPIFAGKESRVVRFHANQGLVLLIFEVGYAIASSILTSIFAFAFLPFGWVIRTILSVGGLAFLALAILGIVNVCQGRQKPLPVIGGITILR